MTSKTQRSTNKLKEPPRRSWSTFPNFIRENLFLVTIVYISSLILGTFFMI